MQVALPKPKSSFLDQLLKGIEHQKIHLPQRKVWYTIGDLSLPIKRYLEQRGYNISKVDDHFDAVTIKW